MWPCTLPCPLLAQYDPLWFLFTYEPEPSCLHFISPQSVFWKQKCSHLRKYTFAFLVEAFSANSLSISPSVLMGKGLPVYPADFRIVKFPWLYEFLKLLSLSLVLSSLSYFSLYASISIYTHFLYIYMKYKHITLCRYHFSMSLDIHVCVYTNADI